MKLHIIYNNTSANGSSNKPKCHDWIVVIAEQVHKQQSIIKFKDHLKLRWKKRDQNFLKFIPEHQLHVECMKF